MPSPTDRYIILDPQGQPVFSSQSIYTVVLWFWGRTFAITKEELVQSPWTILDYEKPIKISCDCVNCIGVLLGDPRFLGNLLCPTCIHAQLARQTHELADIKALVTFYARPTHPPG